MVSYEKFRDARLIIIYWKIPKKILYRCKVESGASCCSEGPFYMIKVAVDVIQNLKKSEESVTAVDITKHMIPNNYRFVVHIQGFLNKPKSATSVYEK